MKTFSRVAIATLTMVGMAGAQPAPPAPKADAKPAGAQPAPVAPKPADAKPAGAQPVPVAPKPADAKAAVPKAADPKPAAPKPMLPPPEPPLPAEIDAMAKILVGTWRCKGDEWDDKGGKGPITATNKVKLDLDNWWISETLEVKGVRTFKLMAFSTYDNRSRKWRRVAVMNRGGQMIGTSDGMKDQSQKMTWNMDLISPMGSGLFRDYLDASDPKVGLKASGEFSLDRGKTWLKAYEMICKK